ncbi:MAG: hypothetical protein ACI9VR_002759 [Cognaticolwellia sp.]|jgi:hypothetical protein
MILFRRAVLWSLLCMAASSCTGEQATPESPKLPELPPVADPVQQLRGPERALRELTVVLSGELRGEIEPCGCPTLPYGGFDRRAVLLEQIRAEGRPMIQVDAGDALLKGLVSKRSDAGPRAVLIAGLFSQVSVDVFVPGPSDVAAVGLQELGGLGLPLTSATWADAEGELLYPAFRIVEREGLKVAVVGLSSTTDAVPTNKDPVEALQGALEQVPEGVDLILAVGNLRDLQAQAVAAVPGVSLVVMTPGEKREGLSTSARTPVFELSARGRYLSVLRLALGTDSSRPLLLEEDRAFQDWIRLGGRGELSPALLSEQERLEGVVDLRGLNRGWVEDRPLGAELDPKTPSTTEDMLAQFKADTLKQAARTVKTPESAGPHYATGAKCVSCHSHQVAAWAVRPNHARAMEALFERGEQDNPECVGCHSTGFGQPGGFAAVDKRTLQTWGNVQCEACHGPLGGHPRDPSIQPEPITQSTCTGCHDQANSPGFDYAQYRMAVICPSDP